MRRRKRPRDSSGMARMSFQRANWIMFGSLNIAVAAECRCHRSHVGADNWDAGRQMGTQRQRDDVSGGPRMTAPGQLPVFRGKRITVKGRDKWRKRGRGERYDEEEFGNPRNLRIG